MVVQLGVRRLTRGIVFSLAAAMVCFAVASPSLGGTVLLDDTWADGSRTETNLPTESAVYVSEAPAVTMAAGSLSYAQSTGSRRLATYFTADNSSPQTLGVGDMLKATIEFVPQADIYDNNSRNFRVGLFHSPTGRVAADGFNDNGAGVWTEAEGYAVFFPIQNGATMTTSPFQINKRTGLTNTSLLGSAGAYTTSPSGGDVITWSADELYTLIFELCKVSEDQMDITTTVLDSSGVLATHTVSDDGTTFGAASIYDTFDLLAFRFSSASGTADVLEFRNFHIEVGPKIPEPASLALLGLASLAFVGVARRRQS